MSGSARSDREALRELEALVRALGVELADTRRRAERAEIRVRALEGKGGGAQLLDRVTDLEQENSELRARVEAAAGRTRQMIDRLRFLRQQSERGSER